MLPVCIGSYLKSFVTYKLLILDICHPDSPYLREQSVVIFWSEEGPRAEKYGKHWSSVFRHDLLVPSSPGSFSMLTNVGFYSRVCFIVTFAAILYHSVTKLPLLNIFIYFKIGPNVTKIFYSYSVATPKACPLSSVQRVHEVWWQENTVKRMASVLVTWNNFVIPRLVLRNGRRCLQRIYPSVFCWDSFWFSKNNHTSLLTWIYSVRETGVQN